MQPAWKKGIHINSTVTLQQREDDQFRLKYLRPQNIVLSLMFIIWNCMALVPQLNHFETLTSSNQ